jgi:hypothetical protein
MSWQPYGLDDCAQQVVLNAIKRDPTLKSLNQVFKMRITCAYGLERFWGEYLRLSKGNENEVMRSQIIKDTWQAMKDRILDGTGIILPYEPALNLENNDDVRVSLTRVWEIRSDNPRQAQVVLAVLVSFCDAIVWWKNRLAQESFSDDEET